MILLFLQLFKADLAFEGHDVGRTGKQQNRGRLADQHQRFGFLALHDYQSAKGGDSDDDGQSQRYS